MPKKKKIVEQPVVEEDEPRDIYNRSIPHARRNNGGPQVNLKNCPDSPEVRVSISAQRFRRAKLRQSEIRSSIDKKIKNFSKFKGDLEQDELPQNVNLRSISID